MSYTGTMLKTKEARDAIDDGIWTFLITGDLQKGWDAMITRGEKNLSYPAVKLALIFDTINCLLKSRL